MKIAHPKISATLEEYTVETMVDDGELESAVIQDEVAVNCNIAALQLIDARIENVQFTGAHFSRIVARDVSIRRSDFSSASLDNGMLVRVEFVNCRMTGIDLSYTAIHDVRFQDCQLDRAVFEKADLRRVEFEGCSLDGVDFSAARCVAVEY
ncbi:MAG TPA: pentapeptide repeat-containing protein [Candidatus Saccharimonadales bacterium]|jgi:uncharacterized protein YjbI with pentapeptide repeats|nr:pentapeptide repeat-containing protein [Candidatus Saccharimonadales bacterium]